MEYQKPELDCFKKKTFLENPKCLVSLAGCIFIYVCLFLQVNILYLDKTGSLASTQAYDEYVLKRNILFIFIAILFYVMNLSYLKTKKAHTLDELADITFFSYFAVLIYAILKIIYIIIMPSNTPSAVSAIIPPVLYDILTGFGRLYFLNFFLVLAPCIYIYGLISTLFLKFMKPVIYVFISSALITCGIYLFMKFCLYWEELYPTFS